MARAERRARRRGRTAGPVPETRAERRAALGRRRGVLALVGALIATAVILVAWFPAAALLTQRRTLSSTTDSLEQLRTQDAALRKESKNLSNPTEIARIARQQFQLIAPGEQAYQILPPPGKTGGEADPYSGDPGTQSVVTPSGAAELPPGTLRSAAPATATTTTRGRHPATAPGSSLFTRVLHTLEFWR